MTKKKKMPFRSPFILGEVCFRRFFAMAVSDDRGKEESCRNSSVAIVIPLCDDAALLAAGAAAGRCNCVSGCDGDERQTAGREQLVSRSRGHDEQSTSPSLRKRGTRSCSSSRIRSRTATDEMLMPYLHKQGKQENE